MGLTVEPQAQMLLHAPNKEDGRKRQLKQTFHVEILRWGVKIQNPNGSSVLVKILVLFLSLRRLYCHRELRANS